MCWYVLLFKRFEEINVIFIFLNKTYYFEGILKNKNLAVKENLTTVIDGKGHNKAKQELGLYMQKYCGCIFSEEERYQKQIEKDKKMWV